ncbi:MAG: tetratricopeptide repeat protein [Pseudomonadota bacterium]
MANTRVSRKSLKEPDEFISFSSKLLRQAVLHKTKMIAAISVLLGILIIVSGFRYFSEKAENKGSLMLNRAMDQYVSTNRESGPEKAGEMVTVDFQKILNDYSGRDCGKFARLNFAGICYRSGNFDKAVTLYTQAIDDFKSVPLLRNIATCGLGYVYEEKKEYAKAAGLFESLSVDPDLVMADEVLFALGRLYGLMEKNDKRIQVLGKIADKHPESMYKELVRGAVAG